MTNIESEIQGMFIHIINGLKHEMRVAIEQHGFQLSTLHFMIMKSIHQLVECTPHALSETCQRDKGQVTRILNDMIKADLVSKTPNPHDKRSQLIALTRKGEEQLAALELADQKTINNMCNGLSRDEVVNFIKVGQQMMTNLTAMKKDR